jgi:hypothetical protein
LFAQNIEGAPPASRKRIGGRRLDSQSLLSCQWACDNDSRCRGIYIRPQSRLCYILYDLVECSTSLSGDSYTRNASLPHRGHGGGGSGDPAVTASSEPNVKVKVRVAPNGSVGAVHVVDWRHAVPEIWSSGHLPNSSFTPFELNISSAVLAVSAQQGGRPPTRSWQCSQLNFVLHELGSRPPTPIVPRCAGGGTVSTLTLPSPVPWSIVEVRPNAAKPTDSLLVGNP